MTKTPGSGKAVTKGATVTVHATGIVKETGKKYVSVKSTIFFLNKIFCLDKNHNFRTHTTRLSETVTCRFWSTKDPGQKAFTYQAGVGGVIKGWDMGCLGMQIGEVRELIIPAHEGYGDNGFPAWGIPPKGTLNFTLECLEIN